MVLVGKLDKRAAENVLELQRTGLGGSGGFDFACLGVEFSGSVPRGRVGLGGRITFALDGAQVEYAWAFHIFYVGQYSDNAFDVVSVERPEISHVQALKYILLMREKRLERIVEPKNRPAAFFRNQMHLFQQPISAVAECVITA